MRIIEDVRGQNYQNSSLLIDKEILLFQFL